MHSRLVHILCVSCLLALSYLEFRKFYNEAYPTVRTHLVSIIPPAWLTWGDKILEKLF